jgi:hypothetical protein
MLTADTRAPGASSSLPSTRPRPTTRVDELDEGTRCSGGVPRPRAVCPDEVEARRSEARRGEDASSGSGDDRLERSRERTSRWRFGVVGRAIAACLVPVPRELVDSRRCDTSGSEV